VARRNFWQKQRTTLFFCSPAIGSILVWREQLCTRHNEGILCLNYGLAGFRRWRDVEDERNKVNHVLYWSKSLEIARALQTSLEILSCPTPKADLLRLHRGLLDQTPYLWLLNKSSNLNCIVSKVRFYFCLTNHSIKYTSGSQISSTWTGRGNKLV